MRFCSKPVKRPQGHAGVAYLRAAENDELIPASSDPFEAGLRRHAQKMDKE